VVCLTECDDKEALAHQGLLCNGGRGIVCVTDSVVTQATDTIKHVVRDEN
jgi:hypothetical protein